MLATATAALTPDQIRTYREDGLVIPGFRLPDAVLGTLREALERLIADNPTVRPEMLISAHIENGVGEKTRGQDMFLELAHYAPIVDMVAQLIGPDIILWGCQVFCKPPRTGMEVPWHQDGRYWPIRPLATCTAWVAIDDSRPENGCMRYVPGSQRHGHTFEHRNDTRPDLALDLVLDDDQIDLGAARDVALEAGQLSLHDVYLVHGSNPNRSGRRRAGVAIRYMPATSLFDRAIYEPRETDAGLAVDFTHRPLWLVRGADRAGNTELRRLA
jgi:hypothetical protein